MSLKNIPGKLAAVYMVFGITWVFLSNYFLLLLNNDSYILTNLITYKGWFFVVCSALVFYISANYFIKKVIHSEEALHQTNQSLETTYEELLAAEEELRQQYEELQSYSVKLEQQKEQYEALFQYMLDGFVLFDVLWNADHTPADFRFINVNPSFTKQTGLAEKKVLGHTLLGLFPEIDQSWLNLFREVAITGQPQSLTLFSGILNRHIMLTAYSPESGKVATQLLDVTREREHQAEIEYMAYHDSLTQLPNRVYFRQQLKQALYAAKQHGHALALFFLDLNRFKLINDTLGHAIGDQLLLDVAACLRTCTHPHELVARLGGDEFTILLPLVNNSEEVQTRAEQILSALNNWSFTSKITRITANIGIAIYPDDGMDDESLMKQADLAMYHGKAQGENRYCFYTQSMHTQLLDQISLESRLQSALAHQEFCLHYQPLVNPAGRLIGTEALLRWQTSDRGLVYPGEFISIAEETGLIVEIGRWVLEEACRQNKLWQDQGYAPLFVSVNLSACQFQQADLANQVAQALHKSGLSPEWLNLEITETVAMENANFTIECLYALRNQGVTLALDDFGTGYSSLVYLKRFPIHSLKIDRSFVNDITQDPDDAQIVKTILHLAKNLEIQVVAEGVETKEQAAFLNEHGCNFLQGYYYGKPVPPHELTRWLQSTK